MKMETVGVFSTGDPDEELRKASGEFAGTNQDRRVPTEIFAAEILLFVYRQQIMR